MPKSAIEPTTNPNVAFAIDPPPLIRRISSMVVNRMISPENIQARRHATEEKRKKLSVPHTVEYFHQLDDPYSHLAAAILKSFAKRYDVDLKVHLIRASGGRNQPEFEKLAQWARTDVGLVAPYYGLDFPINAPVRPDVDQQNQAAQVFSGLTNDERIELLAEVSRAIWNRDQSTLDQLTSRSTRKNEADTTALLDEGTKRLDDLGHYSGATFFYGGEWYWGVDRLFHLERRLMDLGVRRDDGEDFLVSRPTTDLTGIDARNLTVDFYCSFNSPYSAIAYERTLEMKETCRCQFNLKPVLPMIMRGVPATRRKAAYIFTDTQREAESLGIPFGPLMIPIGSPTRKAYSLLPWAKEQGQEEQLLGSFVRESFTCATALHTSRGLRKAVEAVGLDWGAAKNQIGDRTWESIVGQNQIELIDELNLWGVPSYRLSGADGEADLVVWGQDRLWLVEAEIRRRTLNSTKGHADS